MKSGAKKAKDSDNKILDELMKVHGYFYEKFKVAKQRSVSSKKPVLVLFGEDHYSSFSSLTEIVGITVAVELGIKRFCYEYDDSRHARMLGLSLTSLRNSPSQMISSMQLIKKLLMNFEPIDQGLNDKDHLIPYKDKIMPNVGPEDIEGMTYRNEIMAEILRSKNQDAFAIVGASHLSGLIKEEKLNENFEVILIDSCWAESEYQQCLRDIFPDLYEKSRSIATTKDFLDHFAFLSTKALAPICAGNAFCLAAWTGDLPVVRNLLTRARREISDEGIDLALGYAVQNSHLTVVEALLNQTYYKIDADQKAKIFALAAENGDINMVHLLYYHRGKQITTEDLRCPVRRATSKGHIKVVDFLLSKVEHRHSSEFIETALKLAASSHQQDLVTFLLDKYGNELTNYQISSALGFSRASAFFASKAATSVVNHSYNTVLSFFPAMLGASPISPQVEVDNVRYATLHEFEPMDLEEEVSQPSPVLEFRRNKDSAEVVHAQGEKRDLELVIKDQSMRSLKKRNAK